MSGRMDRLVRTFRALPRLRELRPDSRATVAERLEALAASQPEHPFLLFDESIDGSGARRQSYGELNRRANRVAWWAMAQGLRHGDVVALLMENRPEYVGVWAGLAKLGITTALINTHLTGAALRHAVEAAGAEVVVLGTECLDRFATAKFERAPRVWLAHEPTGAAVPAQVPPGARDLDADLAERGEENPDPVVREELRASDNLFYIYTSGTTGLPKAARFSHMRFLGVGIGSSILLRLGASDVHYCALPLYHSAGGAMMVSGVLATGATLALRRRFSARGFWDDCRRFGATRFQYIGEFCRYLVNQPAQPNDRDHSVALCIGNGMRPDIWGPFVERFGVEVVEFYAATEGNTVLANLGGPVGSVGRPPLGRLGERLSPARLVRYDLEGDVHPRDERGFCLPCAPNEPGELIGRIDESGPVRFEGYTSQEATQKKILRGVFRPGDAWFRTGDLLRRDAQGWYFFVDRIGDTFRWKGENVSTQEVAEALDGYPGVEMANVYGVQVEGHDGRAGMAALILKEAPDAFDGGAFYRHVEQALPRYAAPLFVRLSHEADTTTTLKLRKVALQEQGFDPARCPDPLFFRDDDRGAYVPFTAELRRSVLAGERKL